MSPFIYQQLMHTFCKLSFNSQLANYGPIS